MLVVPADHAKITVGVETEGNDLKRAVAENSEAMQRVVQDLRDAGVAETDIQTSYFTVAEPGYVRRDNGTAPPRFEVQNSLNLTVRDLGALGSILLAVSSSGANAIRGLSFGVEDPASHQAEARRLAVEDATSKAALYAEAAGITLGTLLEFTEGRRLDSRGLGVRVEPEPAVLDGVPISAATVSLQGTVTLVYAIE